MAESTLRPSWQTRFLDRLRAGRLPTALSFLLIFAVAAALTHLAPWAHGSLPWGRVDPNQFNFLIWYPVTFFSFDYLQRYAGAALHRFRPALDMSDEEFREIERQLTIVPAAVGWAASVVALGISFALYPLMILWPYSQEGLPRLTTMLVVAVLLSFDFCLVYLLARQGMLVSRLAARVKDVNIFHPESFYLLTDLTTRIGLFGVFAGILAYVTNVLLVTTEAQIQNFLFFAVIFFGLALAGFFLPALGIHTRLQEEKDRVARANDERIERMLRAVHQHVDGSESADISEMKDQLSTLMTFRTEIAKISTWPWNIATLRGFLTAWLLPIVLWLTQGVLSRFLAL